jgi:formamidopyrimidine-DNA glycosylase
VPEGLEAEIYRLHAEAVVGRTIRSVQVDRHQPASDSLCAELPGARISAVRRHGKLVFLDTVDGPTLGLHFGMTGRLVVDGEAAIDRLEYGSGRDDPAWDRLVVELDPTGSFRVNDPRRLARFVIDPRVDRLGPDFLHVRCDELATRLGRRRLALKAALLDQSVVAGFGNLCADEVLWQAGLAPNRPVDQLSAHDVTMLHRSMTEHLPAMLERGGSHRGAMSPALRAAMPPCPRDGAPLVRSKVGGRTTVWCPDHQR